MLNKGFNSEEFEAPLAEINMTPFIDIMLVLLVIFLNYLNLKNLLSFFNLLLLKIIKQF